MKHRQQIEEVLKYLGVENEALADKWQAAVEKATFAYHMDPTQPGAHNFWRSGRHARCRWCGRTRWNVRHGNGPARCQERPDDWPPDVAATIREEEERALELLKNADTEIAGLVDCKDLRDLSGKRIAELRHTHGYMPMEVEAALEFEMSAEQKQEFEEEMNRHKQAS